MMDGSLETIDGRAALRFVRRLDHSVERVWRAVSDPAELERWFVAPVEWTPAVGETFVAMDEQAEVTEVDPPRAPRMDAGAASASASSCAPPGTAASSPSCTSSTTAPSAPSTAAAGTTTSRSSTPTSRAASSRTRS